MVTYSPETRVMFRGREYPVAQLQSGEIGAMQLEKDFSGNPVTYLIRASTKQPRMGPQLTADSPRHLGFHGMAAHVARTNDVGLGEIL
jgi:hypothetical protein